MTAKSTDFETPSAPIWSPGRSKTLPIPARSTIPWATIDDLSYFLVMIRHYAKNLIHLRPHHKYPTGLMRYRTESPPPESGY